ncbi:MAG TPA: hypothetical protein VH542_12320 [Steroidobacteraceae bacterium]
MSRSRAAQALCAALLLLSQTVAVAGDQQVLRTEQVFADFLDAYSAVETIDSGLLKEVDGRDGATWRKRRDAAVTQLTSSLKTLQAARLSAADTRVVSHMSATFDELSDPGASMAPDRRCEDATQPQTDVDVLQTTIYACFDQVGNRLVFEGERITRSGALQRLQEIEEPARRKALFFAMAPLWEAVNGRNQRTSPYRRMIAMAATAFQSQPSPLSEAAQALATDVPTLERWLVELLEVWQASNLDSAPIEPWDYRHDLARASRVLNQSMSLEVAAELNQRFFADLGADPGKLGVLFDIRPRPGKAPIAYSDTVRIGRELNGQWRPAISRISANYEHGGLYTLNELTHETGHAVHYIAVRARPAYFWGDTLFIEAFADVPSWSVFEPKWQQKYLGRSVSRSDNLRELYSLVMLDVAWGLFEIRMLRAPETDPNALWTDITSRYLGIVPHPELSWWAVRGQLGSNPGYMINYAIGAIITAEVRERTRAAIGAFDAGNPKWYPWLSENLLKYGAEFDTSELLRSFLGHPLSADVLVSTIAAIRQPK